MLTRDGMKILYMFSTYMHAHLRNKLFVYCTVINMRHNVYKRQCTVHIKMHSLIPS